MTRGLAVFVHMVFTNTDSRWNACAEKDPGEIGGGRIDRAWQLMGWEHPENGRPYNS